MLRYKKQGDRVFELKSYSIIGPVIITIFLLVFGVILLQQGLSGDWTTTGEDMFMAGAGAAMLIGAVLVGILAPHVKTFEFDKANNQFSYQYKKITGTQNEHCPLQQVKGILVSSYLQRSRSSNNGKSRTKTVFEYLLEFENGDRILLGKKTKQGRIAGFMSGSTPKALRELSRFLDIEITEHGLKENIQAVTGAIKDVISSARKESGDGPDPNMR